MVLTPRRVIPTQPRTENASIAPLKKVQRAVVRNFFVVNIIADSAKIFEMRIRKEESIDP